MTIEIAHRSQDAIQCIQVNLENFEGCHRAAARHGFFRLAQIQLGSLHYLLTLPAMASDRNSPEPTAREAAEQIAINLRSFQKECPDAGESGEIALALQQLAVLIERLPARSPEDDPYVDPQYEPRLCDFCETEYRGPAVYCSRRCAYQDAV